MKKKVIFYAPLGKGTPPEKIGGAEVGCKKTMQIYAKAGIEVLVIDKPATSGGKFRFIVGMILTPLKIFYAAKKAGKNTPVHIVGFYNKIARFEHLLMRVSHWCGNKVIYEIRNGSMITSYKEGSKKYRSVIRDLLLESDVVLCQGMEYVDFIQNEWGVKRSFYPNYILDDFVKPNNLNRPYPLKLIYFGRVTEEKNVALSIEILSLIRKKGIDASLDIIGGCSDAYFNYLNAVAKERDVAANVYLYGRKNFDFIAQKLEKAHYFLFPSVEKQEGHSNSLTEAMGCGVVPIVSPVGFNASICGKEELVVYEMDAHAFAQRIIDIEQKNERPDLSLFCYERIKKNYTQRVVSENMLNAIEKLYE